MPIVVGSLGNEIYLHVAPYQTRYALFAKPKLLFSTQCIANLPRLSAHMSLSLSTGSGSEDFRLCMRDEYYFDKSQNGDPGVGPDQPFRFSYRDIKLREAWDTYKMGTPQADREAYETQKKKIHGQAKSGHGPQVLNWTLHHGGVLLMFGDTIQNIFEHSITPHTVRMGQILRFIDPDTERKNVKDDDLAPPDNTDDQQDEGPPFEDESDEANDKKPEEEKVLVDKEHGEKITAWLRNWKQQNPPPAAPAVSTRGSTRGRGRRSSGGAARGLARGGMRATTRASTRASTRDSNHELDPMEID